jgi:hypothetical protein
MGGRRWFNNESKSFEFALESSGIRIIERGRKSASSLTLGKEGVQWIHKGMTDVSAEPPEQSFAKTLREEGRVFVLQKNRNDHGRFVSVTEYGT